MWGKIGFFLSLDLPQKGHFSGRKRWPRQWKWSWLGRRSRRLCSSEAGIAGSFLENYFLNMLEFIKLSVNDYHSIVSTNEGLLRAKLLPNALGVSKACYCVSMLGTFQLLLFGSSLFHAIYIKLSSLHTLMRERFSPPGKENQPKGWRDAAPSSGIFLCKIHILGVKRAWPSLVNEHVSVIVDGQNTLNLGKISFYYSSIIFCQKMSEVWSYLNSLNPKWSWKSFTLAKVFSRFPLSEEHFCHLKVGVFVSGDKFLKSVK